jgi:hypothetical protein
MTAFDSIEKAKKMWALILPEITPPDDRTFYRWLMAFSIEYLERAITRVVWRFREEKTPDPIKVYKFVTSSLIWFREKAEKEVAQ